MIMCIPSCSEVQSNNASVVWNNWENHRTDEDYGGRPYDYWDQYPNDLDLSRSDLFGHFNQSTRRGIISTIKWGYPRGKTPGGTWMGFSTAFRSDDLVNSIDTLQNSAARSAVSLVRRINRSVDGIGTATTSKLAYFAGLTTAEGPCLIYDSMVRRAIRVRGDKEFAALRQIVANRPVGQDLSPAQQIKTYGEYLRATHAMAKRLGVNGDQIELFLFRGRENADELPRLS
jgi:hypothetical protein